jgi:hypothetical protein
VNLRPSGGDELLELGHGLASEIGAINLAGSFLRGRHCRAFLAGPEMMSREFRGRRTEFRGQRSDVRDQKSEDGGRAGKGMKAECEDALPGGGDRAHRCKMKPGTPTRSEHPVLFPPEHP